MKELETSIVQAMKAKDLVKVSTLRMLKSKYQEWMTQKQNAGKDLTPEVKASITKKLRDEYLEDANTFEIKLSGNAEQVKVYRESANILTGMLPKEVREDEIRDYAKILIETSTGLKMGDYIKELKSKFLGADGKVISQVVKSLL